jgi:hypothetical protein
MRGKLHTAYPAARRWRAPVYQIGDFAAYFVRCHHQRFVDPEDFAFRRLNSAICPEKVE